LRSQVGAVGSLETQGNMILVLRLSTATENGSDMSECGKGSRYLFVGLI